MRCRRRLADDHDPTAVIADVVERCALLAGTQVDWATRSALADRLEIGFAERVGRIVAAIDEGWQRFRYEAALRRRPQHESVLAGAFHALDQADLPSEERMAIAEMLDLELDAAVPMLVDWLRTSRYDASRDALVPREELRHAGGRRRRRRREATRA